MKKCIFFIGFFLNLLIGYACQCRSVSLETNFVSSNFVGEIEVIKKYENVGDSEYYKADIKILNLYKGESVKSIYLYGNYKYPQESACWIFVEEKQKLIIFGSFFEGYITLQPCSEILYLKPPKDAITYFGEVSYSTIERFEGKKKMLSFLKDKNINYTSKGSLYYPCLLRNVNIAIQDGLKTGLKNGDFAVFEFFIDDKLKVRKIKKIKGFVKSIDKIIKKDLKRMRWSKPKSKKFNFLSNSKHIIIVYYFENKNRRFFINY